MGTPKSAEPPVNGPITPIFRVFEVVVGLCAWAGADKQAALARAAMKVEAMNEWVTNMHRVSRTVSFGNALRIMFSRVWQINTFP